MRISEERKKLQSPSVKRGKRHSHYSQSLGCSGEGGDISSQDSQEQHPVNLLSEEEEIQQMTMKIREIKLLRHQNDPKNKYSNRNKTKTGTGPGGTPNKSVSSKRRLHHPNLDSVFVGVAHSPYLTDPTQVYTKDTIRTSNALRQLNKTGKQLKKISDLPFDLLKSKEIFVEALEYAPSFEQAPVRKVQNNGHSSHSSVSSSSSHTRLGTAGSRHDQKRSRNKMIKNKNKIKRRSGSRDSLDSIDSRFQSRGGGEYDDFSVGSCSSLDNNDNDDDSLFGSIDKICKE